MWSELGGTLPDRSDIIRKDTQTIHGNMPTFIPPCTTMKSHPEVKSYHAKSFEKYVPLTGRITANLSIAKIHQRDNRSELGAHALLICGMLRYLAHPAIRL